MEFYTFVDITPQLFKNTQKDIPNIDYVYTDNTGKVIKKTISESGDEIIPDDISIVHLVLERDKKVYKSNEHGYADILSATCSTIEYRNQLIEILGGEIIEMKSTGNFSDDEDEEDNESVDSKETDYMYNAESPLSSPKPSTTDIRKPPIPPLQFNRQKSASSISTPRFMDATSINLDKHPLPQKTDYSSHSNDITAKEFAKKYNNSKTNNDRKILLGKLPKTNHEAVLRMFSNVEPTKGGLDNKSIIKSHLNASSRPTSALSQQSDSGSSQQTLFEPGRRVLIFVNSVYKIGILGPPNPNNLKEYIIDPTEGTGRIQITGNMLERVPKNAFKSGDSYGQLDHVAYKEQKHVFLLKKKFLTDLRPAKQRGGKKTKKVHPAKKNITRSKRR